MAEGTISAGMVSAVCIDWRKKEILLVLNADPEKPQNCWGLPGGKMKNGEDIKDATFRELGQETNQKGQVTQHRIEITKTGSNGDYTHYISFVKIVASAEALMNYENAEALPRWIPFPAIISGKVKMFRSHIQGLIMLIEKMAEKKSGKEKIDKHGIKIISEGPSGLLEILSELKNAFDAKGQYINPFNRRR